MSKKIFNKFRKLAEIVKLPEIKPQVIEGVEFRKGKLRRKQILFGKYNPYLGFVCLGNGEYMNLTEMQVKIFEHLIKRAGGGEAYTCGKEILCYAGSRAVSVCHVFRCSPNWRKFIEVHLRGFYRLNLYYDSLNGKKNMLTEPYRF